MEHSACYAGFISIILVSISGLVVKSIVAIDGPRVRFTADASFVKLFAFLTQCFDVC
ncbi:hypothetical protein F5Y18DRAFT_388899 [Xylariaceae sp. FL1019]|nr:hypothetical protein F5Y18DRAFT_388899 [Xylariaceae sp. FL1019]